LHLPAQLPAAAAAAAAATPAVRHRSPQQACISAHKLSACRQPLQGVVQRQLDGKEQPGAGAPGDAAGTLTPFKSAHSYGCALLLLYVCRKPSAAVQGLGPGGLGDRCLSQQPQPPGTPASLGGSQTQQLAPKATWACRQQAPALRERHERCGNKTKASPKPLAPNICLLG